MMNITDQLLKQILDQLVKLNDIASKIEASQRDRTVKESKEKKLAKRRLLTETQKSNKQKMSVEQAVNSILTKKIFNDEEK